ncbi:hypothetical protein [Streptomyces lasalocidi]|uniref:hypothetical protein n=1 Tax=Streptomyces lasalocidi TaxID=324833 RepID=UPI0019D656D8|nr:hypothetical protein [Streptomyces lasalocidi]
MQRFGPLLVQVGLEVIGRRAVVPLPLEQVLWLRGVCRSLDGSVGHAELALDRASAVAGRQRVDGGVLGAGAAADRCRSATASRSREPPAPFPAPIL